MSVLVCFFFMCVSQFGLHTQLVCVSRERRSRQKKKRHSLAAMRLSSASTLSNVLNMMYVMPSLGHLGLDRLMCGGTLKGLNIMHSMEHLGLDRHVYGNTLNVSNMIPSCPAR